MSTRQVAASQSQSSEEVSKFIMETVRFHNALLFAWDELAREFGLTSSRWQVLSAVWDEPRTVSSVARVMGLTRQSVQRTTTRLVEDGFLSLEENTEHVKARLVTLTDKGVSTLQELSAKRADWISELAKDMPSANIRIGVGMMRGLINRLSESA